MAKTEETTITPEEQSAPEAGTTAPATVAKQTPSTATKRRKKTKRTVANGQVHVLASFNNTIVSITDSTGNLLTSSSAGSCGFRGSKKGTAYAAQIAGEKAANEARQQYGLAKVDVFVKGIGQGREAAIRALQSVDLFVNSITDVTGIPHGGVRPRKARRV